LTLYYSTGCILIVYFIKERVMKDKLATGSGLIVAVLASSCCIIPFIAGLIGVSVGSLGIFVVFEKFRIPLILVAIGFLAYAFYKVYRIDTQCGPDGSCSVNPRVQRINKIMLWGFTIVAIVAMLFPKLMMWFG